MNELKRLDDTKGLLLKSMDVLLYSLSDTSKRQYAHTFRAWQSFAADNGLSFADMNPTNLIAFFDDSNLSHSTKLARLSHIRKLLETLQADISDDGTIARMYAQAKLLKLKRDTTVRLNARIPHALAARDVYKVLNVWKDDNKRHIRNRALLAVLIYTGMRRSEAAALRWEDIDFSNEVITVASGKGDKSRIIPILSNDLIKYLSAWEMHVENRVFVFCALFKGDKLAEDTPMTAKAIYDVLRQTGDAIGIDFLAPHDMRRTLITNALNAGSTVADVQLVSGHASASGVLRYAIVKDAKEVKKRIKLSI